MKGTWDTVTLTMLYKILFDVLQKERIDSHVLFDKILFNNFQFNKLKIETCM